MGQQFSVNLLRQDKSFGLLIVNDALTSTSVDKVIIVEFLVRVFCSINWSRLFFAFVLFLVTIFDYSLDRLLNFFFDLGGSLLCWAGLIDARIFLILFSLFNNLMNKLYNYSNALYVPRSIVSAINDWFSSLICREQNRSHLLVGKASRPLRMSPLVLLSLLHAKPCWKQACPRLTAALILFKKNYLSTSELAYFGFLGLKNI